MKYKGKYNLSENLINGRGFGLLTEATGDRGREYEANIVKWLKTKPDYTGSNLNTGVAWDVNIVKKGVDDPGHTEAKLDITAAMGNIKIAGVKTISCDTATGKWNVVFNSEAEAGDSYIEDDIQKLILAALAKDKAGKTVKALAEYLKMKGHTMSGTTLVFRENNVKMITGVELRKTDPDYATVLKKHGVGSLLRLGTFPITGQDLKDAWLKKGRHYLVIGDNTTTVGPKHMIGQCGDADPLGFGLGPMTYPNISVSFKINIDGGFSMQTRASGGTTFGNTKPIQTIIM